MKYDLKLILIGGVSLALPLTGEIVHSFFNELKATHFQGLTIAPAREYLKRHDHSEDKTESDKINYEIYGVTGATRDQKITGVASIATSHPPSSGGK